MAFCTNVACSIGRLIALLAFGTLVFFAIPIFFLVIVLQFVLGLASVIGFVVCLFALLVHDYHVAGEAIAVSLIAFLAVMLISDRFFAARDAVRRHRNPPIPASAIQIDFGR